MNEYIDKKQAIDRIASCYCMDCEHSNGILCRACEHQDDMDLIDDMPAVDVQPVKRGRWMTSHPVDIAKEFKCTACGGLVELPVFAKKCYYDFCPKCGARMVKDGEQNENN